MLTNLNFLTPGAQWPPPSERARIEKYQENEKLFLTQHSDVWQSKFQAMALKFKKKNFAADTPINYQQMISKKTADFVCSEPPKIETEGDTDQLIRQLNEQNFFSLLYEGFIDVSKDGNAIIKIVGKKATAVSPAYWNPVVDPKNLKCIINHVIAYPTNMDKDGKPTELYAEIHAPGSMEVRRYAFVADKQTLGEYLQSPIKYTLSEQAIFVLSNLTHSSSIFGLDDYNIVNDIIAKIMWRLHCADTVLDKHSEPSVSGPSSALEYDEQTGKWFVPLGNYFKRDSDEDPPLEYITWDGDIDSCYKEIEILLDQLYILSEMGQAFADAGGTANDSSGAALKLRMVSPRIKAQRLIGINNATVKKLIYTLAKLNNIDIDYDTLTLHWSDGLPIDEKEQIDMLKAATGDKPVMSQYTALKKRGLSDEEVDAELEQIQNEEAAANPVPDIPRNVQEPETGDEE